MPLKRIEPRPRETSEQVATATRVQIDSPELCGRYTARVLRGVKVGPSPDWLRQRLEALGQASINNVVDATNYVMLELGHPLHAFDMDLLGEQRIVVRRAHAGEKMRTLDGIERALTSRNVRDCRCDARRGHRRSDGRRRYRNSRREPQHPARIRVVRSDFHSPHVEGARPAHGSLDALRARRRSRKWRRLASRRCAELIQQVGGGEVLAGVVDVYPGRAEAPRIELTRKEFLRVMGADVPDADIEAILSALGFAPVRMDAAHADADSPQRLGRAAGRRGAATLRARWTLIEEVARLYGVDKFPARLPAAKLPAARLEYAEAEDRLRESLIGLGYQEIITIPIVDEASDAVFRAESAAPARIANPLAEDASVMRSTGAVTMARDAGMEPESRAAQRSPVRIRQDVWLERRGAGRDARADARRDWPRARKERRRNRARICVRRPERRPRPDRTPRGRNRVEGRRPGVASSRARRNDFVASQRRGGASGPAIGHAGQLSRRVSERFKLRQDAYIAELELEPLCAGYRNARAALRYKPLSRFPAVERDFSLVLAEGTTFAAVERRFALLASPKFSRLRPWICFAARIVPQGKFSLLVRVKFESHQATLTDAQLTDFSSRILAALEEKLGAKLRA